MLCCCLVFGRFLCTNGLGVLLFLCVLTDAKVNNQSETTKCAMESGDRNTGKTPRVFSAYCF